MRNASVAAVALLLGMSTAHAESKEELMSAFADEVCACKDAGCVRTVSAKYDERAKKMGDPTEAEQKAMMPTMMRAMECIMKVSQVGDADSTAPAKWAGKWVLTVTVTYSGACSRSAVGEISSVETTMSVDKGALVGTFAGKRYTIAGTPKPSTLDFEFANKERSDHFWLRMKNSDTLVGERYLVSGSIRRGEGHCLVISEVAAARVRE